MVEHKKKLIKIIFIGTAALLIVLLYFFIYPLYGKYFPKCFLYSFTGLYCPGCGTQRAIAALLQGDLPTALHNNLLAIAALPFLFYSALIFCANTFNKKQMQQNFFYSPLFVKVVLFTVIAFGILRNIPTYPFSLLAPL